MAFTSLVINSLDGNTESLGRSGQSVFGDNRYKVKAINSVGKTTLMTGQSAKLQAKIIPDYAKNKAISYKSSDSSIVTVDNDGNIQGKKASNATVTISSTDGPKKGSKHHDSATSRSKENHSKSD